MILVRWSRPLIAALVFIEGCAPAPQTEPESEEQPAAPVIKSGFVEVGDTQQLYYEEMGEGHPLVMLHGGFLDGRMWDPQFEVFAEHYRVVRYDARNTGRSRGVAGTYSHYQDLAKLLEKLEIEKPALMGLSLGGRTILDFVIAYPDRASAIVLVSPGAGGYRFTSAALEKNSKAEFQAFQEGDLPKAIEYFQRSWTDGPSRTPSEVDPAVREKVRMMALGTAENWNLECISRDLEPHAIGRLAEIVAPTLAVVGELDMPGILEIADAVGENVEGAEVVVIPGVAHMVNMEKPAEFNQIVLEFLVPALADRD